MSKSKRFVFGEDGKAREMIYDDRYDITIHCESQEEHDRVLELLEKAKSMKWIPVTERLPEEGEYVLCSQANGDVGEGKLLQDSCGEWLILYDNQIVSAGYVIAWWPLPEAYKPEEE